MAVRRVIEKGNNFAGVLGRRVKDPVLLVFRCLTARFILLCISAAINDFVH